MTVSQVHKFCHIQRTEFYQILKRLKIYKTYHVHVWTYTPHSCQTKWAQLDEIQNHCYHPQDRLNKKITAKSKVLDRR